MKEEKRTKIDDNEICIKGIDEVPMFSWNTKTKEFYVLGHKFDGINSIEDFINYIHNYILNQRDVTFIQKNFFELPVLLSAII